MQYCQRCGARLIGDRCHKCGKSYEKIKNLDIVKHIVNKEMHRHGIRLPSTPRLVIIIAIVAIAVLLSYIIFSHDKNADTTKSIISRVQNQISTETSAQAQSVPQKASLRVFHQMVNQFGGSIGCFGRVDGGVTNTGQIDAYNVVVTCTAEEVSAQKDMGTLKAGDTQAFQIILNYDCQYQRVEECQVTCSNC